MSNNYSLTTDSSAPERFDARYTLIADTDHSDIEVLRIFRDTLRNFAEAGGQNVVLEQDIAYDELFDLIDSGTTSLNEVSDILHVSGYIPDEHVPEALSISREIFQIMIDYDLNFIARDQEPTEAIETYPRVHEILQTALAMETGGHEYFVSTLENEGLQQDFINYNELFENQRQRLDYELTDYIRQNVAETEKTLIFYGAAHAERISSQLGTNDVTTIYIYNHDSEMGYLNDYKNLPAYSESSTSFESELVEPITPSTDLEIAGEIVSATADYSEEETSVDAASILSGDATAKTSHVAFTVTVAPDTVEIDISELARYGAVFGVNGNIVAADSELQHVGGSILTANNLTESDRQYADTFVGNENSYNNVSREDDGNTERLTYMLVDGIAIDNETANAIANNDGLRESMEEIMDVNGDGQITVAEYAAVKQSLGEITPDGGFSVERLEELVNGSAGPDV